MHARAEDEGRRRARGLRSARLAILLVGVGLVMLVVAFGAVAVTDLFAWHTVESHEATRAAVVIRTEEEASAARSAAEANPPPPPAVPLSDERPPSTRARPAARAVGGRPGPTRAGEIANAKRTSSRRTLDINLAR